MTALKHVTMRLMSSWQRLSGSGVGPESGPLDPRAWAPLRMNQLPPKSTSLFHTLRSMTRQSPRTCRRPERTRPDFVGDRVVDPGLRQSPVGSREWNLAISKQLDYGTRLSTARRSVLNILFQIPYLLFTPNHIM